MPLNLTLPPRIPGTRDWWDRAGTVAEAPIAHTAAGELLAPVAPATASASLWDDVVAELNAGAAEGAVIGRCEV